LTADSLPVSGDQDRERIDAHLKLADHKAFAIKAILPLQGFSSGLMHSTDEAIRIAIERCADWYQVPCLLLSVDGKLTVEVPKLRRLTGVFMLTTEPQMSAPDKQRIGEIYRQKEWRALARGAAGWYPVANAASEAAAIEQALAACTTRDQGCRLYAIGNFRVADD
jgi:adenylate cyclase